MIYDGSALPYSDSEQKQPLARPDQQFLFATILFNHFIVPIDCSTILLTILYSVVCSKTGDAIQLDDAEEKTRQATFKTLAGCSSAYNAASNLAVVNRRRLAISASPPALLH